ncbi:hypothetical protein [Fodinicola acaciae]|uniref:hypothetical protein n=1 Tax=Fodinicola acaciae TaxID=2681555 RepID=UPI0013D408D3|nr:hypothetical protein [Fodinicola acaciae]
MGIVGKLARSGAAVAGAAVLAVASVSGPVAAADPWTSYTLDTPNATYYGIYAASESDAWVVGTVNPYPTEGTVLRHFDGASWSSVTVPNVGDARAISGTSSSDIWIGGSGDVAAGTAHFDGQQWTTHPVPNQWNVVRLLAVGANNVWGVTQTPGNQPTYDGQRLVHFDGSSWKIVTPAPAAGFASPGVELAGSGADDLWAKFTESGKSVLLHGNGATWTQVDGAASSIVALTGNEAWAAGPTVTNDGNGGIKSNPLHWDGHAWTAVDDKQQWTSYLPRIAATGTVWANKSTSYSGYPVVTLVRWTGGQWQEVPGISGVGTDLVFQYAAATTQARPWALFAHGKDNAHQTIKHYTG